VPLLADDDLGAPEVDLRADLIGAATEHDDDPIERGDDALGGDRVLEQRAAVEFGEQLRVDAEAGAGTGGKHEPSGHGPRHRRIVAHAEYVKMNASSIAGIDKEQVEVHVTFAGGSFGLHSSAERDPTTEAVEIARALNWEHPIKVQSLREEEFKVGRYRAMAAHRVRAGAASSGRLRAWHQRIVAAPTSAVCTSTGSCTRSTAGAT
jgi:hypothetical protein